MQKTFTLLDLQLYLNEFGLMETTADRKADRPEGPQQHTVQNLLRYSAALNIIKTSAVGNIYQLNN